MFRKFLSNTCKWILSKIDKKENENFSNFRKYSIDKLYINNQNNNLKKESINRVIYFFNIGNKEVQPHMKLCIQSYKENNSNFDFKFLNMTRNDFYNLDVTKMTAEKHKINIQDVNNIDFYKILYFFKIEWLSLYGGIWCDLNTYCYKSLEELLQYDSFVMSKSFNTEITRSYCCLGIKKGLDLVNIDNIIYPPINLDDENYESMRLAFYSGKLNKNMFNRVVNKKLHNYIYEFNA